MTRRAHLVLLCAIASVFLARVAHAGTYLDTAALLLDESHRSGSFVEAHLGDVQLAAIAHRLAEARVKVGRDVAVPKEVERAHPHLLLALEAAERAMAAAEEGEAKRFMRLMVDVRREEQTFRSILGQQQLTLPDIQKCDRK
jgi:hypothetical protein